MNVYRLAKGGMEKIVDQELQIGQIVWLNGYGQNEQSHERKAIYDIEETRFGKIYKVINLETSETSTVDHPRPVEKLFGIGIYYNQGDTVDQSIIDLAFELKGEKDKKRAEKERKRRAAEDQKLRDTYNKYKDYLITVEESGKSSRITATKNIRRELKREFPQYKFSVTSQSYAGGDSIDVRAKAELTESEQEKLEKIVWKYQKGDFDGMNDIYNYSHSPFCSLFGGVKYAFAR